MDLDSAWDEFRRTHPIEKSSVAEKLDTIAAQLNEIQTDTKRTAEIVPKIMGDEAALGDVTAQPMDAMGGMGAPDMGMPAGEPGAEAMGEPTMDAGVEPPMEDAGLGTGEDLMANDVLDENPMPAASAPVEEDVIADGTELGLEDEEGLDLEDDGLGLEDDDLELDEGLGGGSDSTSLIKEIISEEIADGNYERARKLLDALEAMSGGETEEMTEEEVLPEVDEEVAVEEEPVAGAPEEEVVAEETVEEPPEDESEFKKNGVDGMPPMNGEVGTSIQSSAEGEPAATVAEKIAVQAAEAVEGIVESVLGEGEETDGESKDEGEVEIEIETKPENEESESDEVEKEPFQECNDAQSVNQINKSAKAPWEMSFRDLYAANMAGQDPIGDAVKKSVHAEGDFATMNPRQSMRQAFYKSMTQLDQVQTVAALTQGDAPTGETQLDQVDEEKSVSGGPESVRGSVDAPKQSGADKLDEVDEEKPSSENPPKEGDQLDDVGNSQVSHARTGKDQLDEVDEEKSAGRYTESKDQLDDVDAAKVKKSADNGKEIMSFRDMLAFAKSNGARPDSTTSMNGEIVRPEPGSISKSVHEAPVRMGRGVNPMDVIGQDLAEYKAYMAQKRL